MSTDTAQSSAPAPYKGHKVKHYGPSITVADMITAGIVGLSAAIPISIIDYSIIAKVAGVTDSSKKELIKGCKTLCTAPHKFFLKSTENNYAKVYRACATVYFWTYAFSNSAKSMLESRGYRPEQVNLGAGIASGLVNIALTVWKDGIILKVLPPKDPNDLKLAKLPVPIFSRSLFAVRDMLTCIAAFTIAPEVANYLARKYNPNQLPLSANDIGQIVTPAALQTVTTLIHITAIRYQRTNGALTMPDLTKSLRDNYLQATTLRVCRIIPAFGIGGILNRETRWSLLDKAEPKH